MKRTPHRIKRKRISRRPKTSISKLIKEADRLMSIKVRNTINWTADVVLTKPYNPQETNRCFTCQNWFPIKKLHCGHYLSRYYKAARWDEDNCRPQCMMCNLWKRGDPITFRQNLIKEIGEERVLAVERKRNESTTLTKEYLEQLIATLQ